MDLATRFATVCGNVGLLNCRPAMFFSFLNVVTRFVLFRFDHPTNVSEIISDNRSLLYLPISPEINDFVKQLQDQGNLVFVPHELSDFKSDSKFDMTRKWSPPIDELGLEKNIFSEKGKVVNGCCAKSENSTVLKIIHETPKPFANSTFIDNKHYGWLTEGNETSTDSNYTGFGEFPKCLKDFVTNTQGFNFTRYSETSEALV